MCGILGVIDQQPVDLHLFEKALLRTHHRGPDDKGVAIVQEGSIKSFSISKSTEEARNKYGILPKNLQGNVVFGHNRLSIIDVSVGGHQPFVSEDGRYMTVFNGEIYNFEEIATKFALDRKTKSDTEVLLQLFIKLGEECVEHFIGMWSFAIYDVKENSLFASRDPFGIKPFYYTANKKGFVFGSEVKSMLGFFDPSPEMKTAYNFVINELKDYSGDTFYSGVKQLEPGMNLLYKDGNVMLSKYVEPSRDSMTDPAELRSQFDESMRHHLRSDVEIGVTLSGGIDANIVASVLSVDFCKINVKVFSGVYPGKDFDESEYIDSTVSRYDLDSYKVTPDIEEVKREIPKMIWHEDQPVKVIGVLLNSAVYRLARKSGIKVVLGGQGADEIFAGYDHHLSPFLLSLLLSGNFRRFNHELNMLKQTYSPKIVQRFKKYLAVQLLLYAPLKIKIARRHNSISKSGLYQPEFINENIKHDYKLLFRNTGVNYDVYLKNQFRLKLRDYLDNEDKMSMMHSVESRVPFLGLPFVKYGLGVPLAEKIKNGVRKSILRESFGDILSPLVRDRMDKTGYASPQQEWMCNIDELLEEYLRPKDSFVSNIFQRKALDSMMKDAREKKLKEYLILWRALSLEIWHKKFIVDKGASI